jgi:hypothetical protein
MKIKVSGSFGFAGTKFSEEEEVPEEVVSEGSEAIEKYIEEMLAGHWDSMLNQLSLGYEVIED